MNQIIPGDNTCNITDVTIAVFNTYKNLAVYEQWRWCYQRYFYQSSYWFL